MDEGRAGQLAALEAGTTADRALAFFDGLPAVEVEAMFGSWRGRGIPTGHPFDGMLEGFGWHGKRFDNAEKGHPLLFDNGRGQLFAINPALVPIRPVLRHPAFVTRPAVARLGRLLMRAARTSRPQARLRMTRFRGVATATMIYDALPINDVFRRVDDDIVMGVMDMRYLSQPYMFALYRERG